MQTLDEIFRQAGFPLETGGIICNQIPRDYQVEDLGKFLTWDRCSDFSEVGTGKSLKSYLYIAHKVLSEGKVVVVMPPPLIPQYMHEFIEIIPSIRPELVNFTLPLKKRNALVDSLSEANELPGVSLMSYQMYTKLFKWFISMKVTAIVCDEAHAIKEVSTKNFKSVYLTVLDRGASFLEMTATPMTAELRDAYAHIRIKTPGKYPSLRAFDDKHTIYKDIGDFPKIVGYRDEPTIQRNLNLNSVRRRAAVVLNLKEPMVVEQLVPLSDKHMKLYQKLLRERILEYGDQLLIGENPQKLRQMALQIITNVEAYTTAKVPDAPLDMLKVILDSLGGKKLLVFCQYRATVEKLGRVFERLNPALMYGGSDVPKNKDKFNNDPTCLIGVANYRSGGAGLNLQAHCHNEVFLETTGVPSELTQAIGRLQRSGQTEVVNVWLFRYTNTISVRQIDSALKRAVGIKLVMKDEASVLDALMLER